MSLEKLFQDIADQLVETILLDEGASSGADYNVLCKKYGTLPRHFASPNPFGPRDIKLTKTVNALGLSHDATLSGTDKWTEWDTYTNADCAITIERQNNKTYIKGYATSTKAWKDMEAALALENVFDPKKRKIEDRRNDRAARNEKLGFEPGMKVIAYGKLGVIYEITRSGKLDIRLRNGEHITCAPTNIKPYDATKSADQLVTPTEKKKAELQAKLDQMGIKKGDNVIVNLTGKYAHNIAQYGKQNVEGVFNGFVTGAVFQVLLPPLPGTGSQYPYRVEPSITKIKKA